MAAAVAVIAVAFCAGYYVIGGGRPTKPSVPEQIVAQTPTGNPAPAPAKPVMIAMKPRSKNSDYTAPNAPRIQIVEERAPSLTNTSKLQPKIAPTTTDTEATQTGAPPTPKTAAVQTPADNSTDTTSNSGSGTDTTASSPTPSPGDNTNPAPPADPDVEQVGGNGNGSPDSEAGQDGSTGSGKAQYRVQTGSFVTADNARALADALHRRGYATSTHAERDGGKTVYRVQIGAYRNKAAADKAAQDLQSNGYPAYVSPLAQ